MGGHVFSRTKEDAYIYVSLMTWSKKIKIVNIMSWITRWEFLATTAAQHDIHTPKIWDRWTE